MIDKNDLSTMDYDLILVIGKDASLVPILKEADELKINPDKVILDRTICVPGFSIERYKKLRNSKLSIFALSCWGGLIYHQFGLPFLTPAINMFFGGNTLKFLSDPFSYFDKELKFLKFGFEKNLKCNYPIFTLDDLELHMNHYGDVGIEGARKKWTERCQRINRYNTLVMAFTEKKDFLEKFDKISHAKKVCFVNFETDLDSGFYIEPEIVRGRPFYQPVNQTSLGFMNYDLWDLLIYGKKTPIKIF